MLVNNNLNDTNVSLPSGDIDEDEVRKGVGTGRAAFGVVFLKGKATPSSRRGNSRK